ncbi:unnamed protein product [Tuber aestivum]|uniref:Uncharacterized protein n=1 Tax=Tuber aestivum TaxID=59557 RepID=A0A292Q6D1_9PEZI|nr:unnamed protein product [Tuber aestivum]
MEHLAARRYSFLPLRDWVSASFCILAKRRSGTDCEILVLQSIHSLDRERPCPLLPGGWTLSKQ